MSLGEPLTARTRFAIPTSRITAATLGFGKRNTDFAAATLTWIATLQYPILDGSADPGISMVELYLNMVRVTGMRAPISRLKPGRAHRLEYFWPEDDDHTIFLEKPGMTTRNVLIV